MIEGTRPFLQALARIIHERICCNRRFAAATFFVARRS
jgi:hypothetical protein